MGIEQQNRDLMRQVINFLITFALCGIITLVGIVVLTLIDFIL